MKIRTFFAALAVSLLGISCSPNISPESGWKDSYDFDPTGGQVSMEYTASGLWNVSNSNDWFTVSPSGGNAGKISLTVKVKANNGLQERTGTFYIIDGAKNVAVTIKQGCGLSMKVAQADLRVPYSAGTFYVHVDANISYNVTSSADWIKCPTSPVKGTADVEFKYEDNGSEESRTAVLTFTAVDSIESGSVQTVNVKQAAFVEVDWNEQFYKSVLGFRFTGTWCGYCPNLAYALEKYDSEDPERFQHICFYDSSSDKKIYYKGTASMGSKYSLDGYPAISPDGRGIAVGLTNSGFYSLIKTYVKEVTSNSQYMSETGISVSASLAGDKVTVTPTVYTRKAAMYHIHVALLENGIKIDQTNYTEFYGGSSTIKGFVHNNVVREYATDMLNGEEFTAQAKGINEFSYTINVPSNVIDTSNLSVVVYVTKDRPDGPTSASGLKYNKLDDMVDNCVICPVGSVVDLRYED